MEKQRGVGRRENREEAKYSEQQKRKSNKKKIRKGRRVEADGKRQRGVRKEEDKGEGGSKGVAVSGTSFPSFLLCP